MRILLFTSQDISRKLVEFFFRRSDVDLTVVTQVTQRDQLYGFESATNFCTEHGIPCWLPRRLDNDFVEKVSALNPDLIVAAYFPQIFPQALLDIPRLGAINVHPGDLPYYRGTFAIPWTILNGEKELTVTLHYIDSRVDAGDIIAKKRVSLNFEETGFELYLQAMHLAAELLMDCFDDLVLRKLERQPQVGYGSYYNKLERRCHIDWHQTREQVKRLVRVHAKPYLPAFTYLINRCVYINKATFCETGGTTACGSGYITQVLLDKRFAVACVDGWILVEDYEVSPPLDDEQFGQHFKVGARFE
jgi:methionyl-tRNA formyltransferase